MSIPVSRQQFADVIMRRLGAPVIKINVDPQQVDDAIDRSLLFWGNYYTEGTQLTYFKIQVTEQIQQQEMFPLPENVIGAVEVFPMGAIIGTGNIFNIQYQIALNDLYTLTSQSIVPYFMAFQHVQLLEEILVGIKPVRWNRYEGNLHIDMDWGQVAVGSWIIVKAYQLMDPTVYPSIWQDFWLQEYCEAQVGILWGNNLSKFSGIQMPGGITLNGDKIIARYEQKKAELEHKLMYELGTPIPGQVG